MNKRNLKLDQYGITKHRYMELKSFCLQYPEWQDKLMVKSNPMKSSGYSDMPKAHNNTSQVENIIIGCDELKEKIELVNECARIAAGDLWEYIVKNVCYDRPFSYLQTIMEIPCSERSFYDKRRHFFYILNGKRQ